MPHGMVGYQKSLEKLSNCISSPVSDLILRQMEAVHLSCVLGLA